MRLFRGFEELDSIVRPVVTLGSFDGVHAGHRRILDKLKSEAERINGESVVITFEPHPRQIIYPNESIELLTTLEEKAELLSSLGIDNLLVIKFNEQFRQLNSDEFVKDYLIGKLGIKSMIVGYNHHFGHNRSGDFNHLKPLHNELGFNLLRVDKFDNGAGKISSTEIRKLIKSGSIEQANQLLEYQYSISGSINHDNTFIKESPNKIIPDSGTYKTTINNSPKTVKINSQEQIIICENTPAVETATIKFLQKII